jgi:hypothetical protein
MNRSKQWTQVPLGEISGGGMADFQWDDPLLLEGQLDAAERQIAASARRFAQGRLLPLVVETYREERGPMRDTCPMGWWPVNLNGLILDFAP